MYFIENNKFETLSNKRKFDISCLKDENKPKLKYSEYQYQSNNSKYAGEWLGGFRHGKGTQTFANGSSYVGDWFLGRAHGKGRFHNTITGYTYEGDFYDDVIHGQGKFECNGAVYIGPFNRELKEGDGYEKDEDGNVYIGNFFEGRKDGFGRMTYATGVTYVGMWYEGKVNGFG